jgi:hypothetical protein
MIPLKSTFGISHGVQTPFEYYKIDMLVALQLIRVTDAQDNEVLSVNIQNGGTNRVMASNEIKRPIEFIQVQILAWLATD